MPPDPRHLLILDAPALDGDASAEPGPERGALERAGHRVTITDLTPLPRDERLAAAREALPEVDAILTTMTGMDGPSIERAERCLAIIRYGPGIGAEREPIDIEAARSRGIYVTSIPDWASEAWAEETWEWIGEAREGARGPLRLGLIGLGQVGRRVAKRASKAGLEVWAHDPFVDATLFDRLGVRRGELDDLLGICDTVSLHVPPGPGTEGLLDVRRLGGMRPEGALVNTASPRLVDLAALRGRVEAGQLRRALLATAEEAQKPPAGDWPAGMAFRQVQAGRTGEARLALRRRAGRLLARIFDGGRPEHLLIDPPCPRQVLWSVGVERAG